jgi:hypothetical protein
MISYKKSWNDVLIIFIVENEDVGVLSMSSLIIGGMIGCVHLLAAAIRASHPTRIYILPSCRIP